MRRLLQMIPILCVVFLDCKNPMPNEKATQAKVSAEKKPTVSFTFDDGDTSHSAGFEFQDWNAKILDHLSNENLKAIFFVTGRNKQDTKGQFLLESWNARGHNIANHTFSHPNFNMDKNNALIFTDELIKTDAIISAFANHTKLFRFPYLKEGANELKVDSLRNILKNHGYTNGYVTIDASDWYVNQRLVERINQVGLENTEIEKFRDFYVQHIMERANFYETLSQKLNNRHIQHTLLLHHNITSALFLVDLISAFKKEGWSVIDAHKAYQDPIFQEVPSANFAGESLIWSQAKQTGKYEHILRYPAEDSRYEKKAMNRLGL